MGVTVWDEEIGERLKRGGTELHHFQEADGFGLLRL